MTSENSPRIRVLSDKVADKDELGSHQLIADSVADLISSEQDGKSIALTGPWGSGKSSVIKMLQEKLGDDSSLFLYDAWAHERDPLRRSFLEHLIDHLSPSWIDEIKWTGFRDELAKRRETTKVTNYSELTWFGILLSVTVVLIPIGFTILNQASWDKVTWMLVIGLLLGLSPILLGLVKLACNRKELKDPDSRKRVFALLTGESTRTFKTDTYRTPDPTSIEFREAYKNILSEALSNNNRKIIIVIDNLDRLDTDNALAMWATMKTFLDFRALGPEGWSDRLWLIVPFDPTAMKQLWDGDAPERKGHGDLAESFIDKTFQVTFHVPSPVLSNWVAYLKNNLRYALPEFKDEDEIHAVYRVFRLKKFRGVSTPTPREIKIFINRIGALYRLWHDVVKLRILALYAVIEEKENLVELLQTEDESIAAPLSMHFLGDDYVLLLASIHFNVPKDDAAQVLLGPKLERHIFEKDADSFVGMRKMIGFAGVLEDIVESDGADWAKEHPSVISWLPGQLEVKHTQSQSERITWDNLCRSALEVESWQSIDEDAGTGLTRLIEHNGTADFAEQILQSISKTVPLPAKEDQPIDSDTLEAWLQGCAIVIKRTAEVFGIDIIQQHFRCPGDAQTYLSIITQAMQGGSGPLLIQNLRPKASAERIVAVITKVVTSGEYSSTMRDIVRNLTAMEIDWLWKGLIQALSTRAKAPNNIEPAEVAALLETLKDLESHTEEATIALSSLATGPDIFHHLHTTHEKQHSQSTALCFYLALKHNTGGSVPQQLGNSASGIKVFNSLKSTPANYDYALDDLIRILVEYDEISLLFGPLTKDKSIRPLRLDLIKRLALREDTLDLVSVQDIVHHEADFYFALTDDDDTYQATVDRFVKDAKLIDALMSLPFDPGIASLYRAALLSPFSTAENYKTWLVGELKHVSEDMWISELDVGCHNLFDLLATLRAKNVEIGLAVEFRNALTKCCEKIDADSPPKADLTEMWEDMLDSLDEDYRKTFLDQTINKIIESRISHAKTIELFGGTLLDCERLEIAKDDLIQKGFPNFVEHARIDELRWFSSVLQKCPDVIKKCRRENRATLKGEVKHLLAKNDLDEEIRKVLSEIAQTIGVPLPSHEVDKEVGSGD